MGRRIRQIRKHVVYETVQGIIDRQFMFKPDHLRDNKLLSVVSPPSALDPSNDLTPIPSTYNIIGAAIGRALREVPVKLHCYEANLTHKHAVESVDDTCCRGSKCKWAGTPLCGGVENHPVRFHQRVNSVIAQQLNAKYDREGHLWSSPDRITECLDDRKAEERLLYALTNLVKDGLVETVGRSPLFSTYNFWAKSEKLRFWYIDWEAYHLAGGVRKRGHRPKDHLHWVEWEPEPLPNWADAPSHRYAAFIRQNCREVEEQQRIGRKKENKPAPRLQRLFELDPRDHPQNPRQATPQPLCHASDPQEVKEFRKQWREFVNAYRQASWNYRMGDEKTEFPLGSFRPPLVKVYNASYL